jgi:hypothetical protein
MAAGEKIYENLSRFRRGRAHALTQSSKRRWFRVPPLPRLLGVGVIVRRQALTASRSNIVVAIVALALAVGAATAIFLRDVPDSSLRLYVIAAGAGIIGFYMMLSSGIVLRLDFRGELETMERLKTLPLRPWAVAFGEVLAPTMFVTLVQVLFALAAGSLSMQWAPAISVALAMAPVNLFVFSLENVFFLLFPAQSFVTPGDVQAFGLQVLLILLKAILVVLTVGSAAAVGVALHYLGLHWMLGAGASWVMMMGIALAASYVVAWAFDQFDPSMDTVN